MNEELSIDEELKIRHETAEEVMALVDSFFESVEFYKKRATEAYINQLKDKNTLGYLLPFVKAESWNVLEKMKMLNKMQKESMLPLTYDKPWWKYKDQAKILKDCSYQYLINLKHPEVQAFFRILDDINKEFMDYELYFGFSHFTEKEMNEKFESMKTRWKDDHPRKLEYYIEDIYNYREAVRDLRREFKEEKAVSIWNDCGRILDKTIAKMKEEKCTEMDLLPLIHFAVKYDMLHERLEQVAKAEVNLDAANAKKVFMFGNGAQTTIINKPKD